MPNQLINASVIYDGGDVTIPDQLLPSGLDKQAALARIAERQQMAGTPLEQLCEIAGRACYDSLGAEKSRSSAQYHPHILQVQHLSTVEHANQTFNIHTRRNEDVANFAPMFLNRPNVWVRQTSPYDLQVTLNLRHILEWDSYKQALFRDPAEIKALGEALKQLAASKAPQIVVGPYNHPRYRDLVEPVVDIGTGTYATLSITRPYTDEEKWVSVFMTGSRGFSHEQVRHGDWTAISQRSTRFVDESTSPWVKHPLEIAHDEDVYKGTPFSHKEAVGESVELAKERYAVLVAQLEPWLIARGVDKATARKQARGAARGYLGNALYTEIVFSASVSQWKRMIRQRLSPHADAEIREVYTAALPALKACRYGDCFASMTTAPSPDGIGQVLVEA